MSYDYAEDLVIQTSILGGAEEHPAVGAVPGNLTTLNGTDELDVVSTVGPLSTEPSMPEDLASVELFHGYSTALLSIASACCVLFMLVGIPGNLITIIALFRCKKVRNATAVFIINLSVSDLMSCCFNLPLAASTFWQRAWSHGLLLCRLFPLLRYGLLAVSLFTVLAITINRYVMIGHPTLYPKLYKKQYLGMMVASTWLCGFGALVATWMGKWGRFGLDQRIGSCSILPDSTGKSPKEFLFLVAFVIPCIAIVVCYARIFYIVRKTAMKSRLTPSKNVIVGGNSGNSLSVVQRGYYNKMRGKKYFGSSGEDSAIGSTSTGPSISTDKSSSFLDNGTSNTEVSDIRLVSLSTPHLLSPRVGADPSSSSGMEEGHDEEPSSRSASPTSANSSRPPSPHTRRKNTRRKERLNSTLSHVASVFRRTSHLRCSPRRPSAPPIPGKMTAKDKKLLKMILVIFASFVTCYLPITISKTYRDRPDLRALNIAGYILIYLTTCINPIIYVVMSSEYRQAYKNLLMCRSGDSQMTTGSRP